MRWRRRVQSHPLKFFGHFFFFRCRGSVGWSRSPIQYLHVRNDVYSCQRAALVEVRTDREQPATDSSVVQRVRGVVTCNQLSFYIFLEFLFIYDFLFQILCRFAECQQWVPMLTSSWTCVCMRIGQPTVTGYPRHATPSCSVSMPHHRAMSLCHVIVPRGVYMPASCHHMFGRSRIMPVG